MSQLKEMMQKLKPALHKIEINGFELYIHRPKLSVLSQCDNQRGILIHCVSDKDGNPVFSETESETAMLVDDLDPVLANEITQKVMDLMNSSDSVQEETEKK